ncbi:MAG: glycosyltransferase family 2 protein [Desulfurococcales archaeon]|nr:glycosyltransferase family 2 protein [Desulfurococcales archaeon]
MGRRKGLVVLLTKNDAEGLRRALTTLVRQDGVRLGEDFDILVADGGSTDDTEEVVKEFQHVTNAVRFKVQEIKGGVGPARIEVARYALNSGYEWVVWGDSGNEYEPHYLTNLLRRFRSAECDVVSGRSVVKDLSTWSKMLYWYHL